MPKPGRMETSFAPMYADGREEPALAIYATAIGKNIV
jgi:hypothetical protein